MSRVLKSTQVIIDKSAYKLTSSDFIKHEKKIESISKNEKSEDRNIKDLYKEIEEIKNSKLLEAEKEAERIINDAYEKAKQIIQNAREEGYEKGFEEGVREGFEKGKKRADEIISEALNIKEEVMKFKENFIVDIERDVVDLVIKTIEKILNKKIKEDYDIIYGLIKAGLEKCAFTDSLVLRVSPDDYEFALEVKDKILALSENVTDIIIKQDKSLSKGSCIIDTSSGSVDSSIWTQFNQIKNTFEEILKGE
ncbi:flagellar assembly protein FliH [Caminicella sporogenes DSM 14501]|uniref:Flagellar assembly protein FliH n=1 Tax=Caminicella sporogenes DSM 14501 TaxID=1121266 RepID=A0A1M6LCS0_9FIRM|nr:FliH/SctL family protein [Caminicella sporogenes]RKD27789.1 hypothetical protein BET04_01600 [Caminicella sporogenes]SHJ68974.1 flagellar assembly protein FliH [Caminicella sporogenes DSM 14501]